MWVVWSLGILVGVCMLLSMLDRPHPKAGTRQRRRI